MAVWQRARTCMTLTCDGVKWLDAAQVCMIAVPSAGFGSFMTDQSVEEMISEPEDVYRCDLCLFLLHLQRSICVSRVHLHTTEHHAVQHMQQVGHGILCSRCRCAGVREVLLHSNCTQSSTHQHSTSAQGGPWRQHTLCQPCPCLCCLCCRPPTNPCEADCEASTSTPLGADCRHLFMIDFDTWTCE